MAADYIPYTGPIVTRAEAKARGMKRYFICRPCPTGHSSQRFTSNGRCTTCSRSTANDWYHANLENNRSKGRAYLERHRQKRNGGSKAWYHANKERSKESSLAWQKKNPERYRELVIAGLHARRARKVASTGKYSPDDIARIRRDQRDRCAYCRIKLKGSGQIDHIIPLAGGGSNWPNNLQLVCKRCNCEKSAAHPLEHARRCGFLL